MKHFLFVLTILAVISTPAYSQIDLDTDYFQGFEDTTVWGPNEWYMKSAWSQATTTPRTGTYYASSTVNATTDYGHAILIYVNDPGTLQIPGKTLIEYIRLWYRIANASANARYIRIMATDEWPRIWDSDLGDYDDADPDVLVNAPSGSWDASQWIDLTGWKDIRNQTSYDSVTISDTNLLVMFEGTEAWIGIFAKIENTSMTLRLDDFEINLNEPTIPNIPNPLSPTNGETFHSPVIDFSWRHNDTDLTAQASYQLQISTDSTFGLILDTSDGFGVPDTSTTFTTNLTYPADSIIYWRIRTSNYENYYSEWSAGDSWIEVKLHISDTPILISPSDSHETTNRSIRFQWFHNDVDSSAQEKAHIQFSTQPDFAAAETVVIIGDTEYYDTTFLDSVETVYWRVRTSDILDVLSPFSESRALIFTLEDTPVITNVNLSSDTPLRAITPLVFDTSVSGDTIWLGSTAQTITASFYVISHHFDSIAVSGVFDSASYILYAPSPCTTYFYVKASHISNGDTYTIITAWDNSGYTDSLKINFRIDTIPPSLVSLTSPSQNDFVTSTPTFDWNTSSDTGSGLAYYTLQIAADSFFNTVITTETTLSDSLTISTPLAESIYWWRILATDSVGNFDTVSAETRSIIVDSTPPSQVTLAEPSNSFETTLMPLYFRWSQSSDTLAGLKNYILQISKDSGFNSFDTSVSVIPSETQTTTGDTLKGSYRYYWRITALDSAGNFSYSSSRSFVVDTTSPSAPNYIAPSPDLDTTSTSIKFDWDVSIDSHTGISSYNIQISNTSNFSSTLIDSSTGTQTDTTLSLPVNDTYWWRITAYDSVSNSETGSSYRLRIDTAPPSKPTLTSPVGSETTYSPVGFYWTNSVDSITGVASYKLQVSTSSTFASYAVNSTMTEIFDTSSLDTGIYYWRVVVTDSVGNYDTSTTETFEVVLPPDTSPPAQFTLTSPSDNYETTNTTISFRWENALDSSSPVQYYLVVNIYSGTIVDSTITTDTYSSLTIPANDSYRWSVTAIDPYLNERLSTDTFTLIIDTSPPTVPSLLSPSSMEETSSPVTFKWSASTDTFSSYIRYRIQVCTSPAMSGNMIIDGYQTASETSVSLSADTYYWKISANDTLGNTVSSETRGVVVYYSGESTPPEIVDYGSSPDTVTNIGTDTSNLWIWIYDTSAIETAIINLSPLGLSYSPAVQMETYDIFGYYSGWYTNVTIDTTVLGDTYYLNYYAIDEWNNISTGTIRLRVNDISAPYSSITSLPSPSAGETFIIVSGNALTLVCDTAAADVVSVLFEYRVSGETEWKTAEVHPLSLTDNPASGSDVWSMVWELPDSGYYDIRPVGITSSGNSDPSPSFITISVQETGGEVSEIITSESQSHIFYLYQLTSDTVWFDTIPLLYAGADAVTSRDSVMMEIIKYSASQSDAPLPQGTSDGSGLVIAAGTTYYKFTAFSPLDSNVLITIYISGLSEDSSENLSWYKYNRTSNSWNKIQSTALDLGNGIIKLSVLSDTFSYWAPLIGLAANSLANVILYPNPYIPNDNNDKTGVPFVAGVDGTGIIFENLTNSISIEIYNAAGKLVTKFSSNNTGGKIHWNAKNDSGQDVASGMYVAVIKSSAGERVIKKLMIIR